MKRLFLLAIPLLSCRLVLAAQRPDAPLHEGVVGSAKRTDGAAHAQRLLEGWEWTRGELGGIWEVWRGEKASSNVPWQKVQMPHCYNALDAVDPDATYYQGPAWYRTRVEVRNPYPRGRILLRFEGAGQKTDVYVWKEKAGSHLGGYDEFTVDVTQAANAFLKDSGAKEPVPIAVRCDNSRDLEMIPSSLSDFNVYGGLYRYVDLEYVPAISLQRVLIEPQVDPAGKASVLVTGRLYNPLGLKDQVELSVEIRSPDGKTVKTASQTLAPWTGPKELLSSGIDAPALWSPSTPNLYQCIVTLSGPEGTQQVAERFGLRRFEFVKHGPFKLNGRRLLLQGTHRHEDHAGLGAAMTEDLIRKEMRMIKEMGANFIRLGHYQQSRIVLEQCDELGLLVWEEIPWCRGGLGGDRYREQARNMLRAMIDQHRNHPSVIIWGLGNENDWPGDFEVFDQQAIRAFMQELNDLSHQLDPGRKTAIRRCEFCKDIVDVYSPSIWAGWYSGRFTEYKSESEKKTKEVSHFLHAEWGADSHARRHSEDPDKMLTEIEVGKGVDERGRDYYMTGGKARASKDGDWSESYACNLIDWHLKEQETMDWLTGAAYWIFKDFSTPLRPENPVPYVNQKGVVERDLTPKESYYVFQSYWADKPTARIYGHTWPVRWGAADEKKLVKVYSNCRQAELFLNGVSCGKKNRDSRNYPAAGLRWAVQFQPGENRLKVVAENSGITVTDEITLQYQTRKWDQPAQLVLEEISRDGQGKVTVQARALDPSGAVCLDARNPVSFGISGDGRLLDNLGTSIGARKVQLYNGRAQISLETGGGQSVVSVAADGLKTQFLSIVPRPGEPEKKKAQPKAKPEGGEKAKPAKEKSKSKGKSTSSRETAAGSRKAGSLVESGVGNAAGAAGSLFGSGGEHTGAQAVRGNQGVFHYAGFNNSGQAVRQRSLELARFDKARILKAADAFLREQPVSITQFKAPRSTGGPNDYYSEGDYWWPDPSKPGGLPYVQRDGQTNPDNFDRHRLVLRQMREAVAALAAAYAITGKEEYAQTAVQFLKVFFLDEKTRMNPHLLYAQAIPGKCSGRGVGIIDTLHLIEVPVSVGVLEKSPALQPEMLAGLKRWFADYLQWMTTHPYGQEEISAKNNHSVAFAVQAAVFARFTGNAQKLEFCRKKYKEIFVPQQMAADGSFPAELKRTKPYGYSIFQLDNMATLCHVLSTPEDDLWKFELPDGRGIRKAMEYLYPYLEDKKKWPFKPDVMHFEGWPVRQPGLLLAGYALGEQRYLDLWKKLEADPTDMEVKRNVAIGQPLLWVVARQDVPLLK